MLKSTKNSDEQKVNWTGRITGETTPHAALMPWFQVTVQICWASIGHVCNWFKWNITMKCLDMPMVHLPCATSHRLQNKKKSDQRWCQLAPLSITQAHSVMLQMQCSFLQNWRTHNQQKTTTRKHRNQCSTINTWKQHLQQLCVTRSMQTQWKNVRCGNVKSLSPHFQQICHSVWICTCNKSMCLWTSNKPPTLPIRKSQKPRKLQRWSSQSCWIKRPACLMKQFSLLEIVSTATVLLAMVVESSGVFHVVG